MFHKTGFIVLSLSLCLSIPASAKSKQALPELLVPDILDYSALKDGHGGKSNINPCQDFYQFACGAWIDNTIIPDDKNYVAHQSTALLDQTDHNLNNLLLKLQKNDPALITPATKQLSDYYESCMNYGQTVDTATALLMAKFSKIQQLQSKAELSRLSASLQLDGTNALFNFGSGQDLKDSNSVIGFLDQGGMGLPEPSYYFEKEKKSIETRKKYLSHIEKMFVLIGNTREQAHKNAKTVMKIESDLASKAYSFDDRQNPAKINHPMTREDLKKFGSAINWDAYFDELKSPKSALNVNEPEFFAHLNEVINKTALIDLKIYLSWQLLHRSAAAISPALDQENFNFWNKYLHGEKTMKPRWKRCTQAVEHKLGYALAESYVKTVDTAAIRTKIQAMIDWIKQTFQQDLENLSSGENAWLDIATKDEALKKLKVLGQKLGAPNKWRDYSSLKTDRSSYFSNEIKTDEFESRRDLNKIGKPVDRQEWDMMPWEINAYYDPAKNEFVFPFGILQPPSFDVSASDGANLGAFGGGTIGHELTHGYDNDGRQYDASGNLKDWWTEATKKRFEEKTECFIKQANAYKIEEVGLNVDGKKSLPENLADQGGVKLGYAALLLAQSKRPPSLPWKGYSENQQYWIAYAQSWCTKTRAESLRVLIKTNPHPPEEFRVNGVVMNRPEFARDFSCKEGSRMAPKDRCSIW